MSPQSACESCDRRAQRQPNEWCTYFTFSPKEHCTHNTFTPAAGMAMRMASVQRIAIEQRPKTQHL